MNCTETDDEPPLLVNLLSIIDKCWKGKQQKFYKYLLRRNILSSPNVMIKGLILILNVLIYGKQEG